MRRTLSLRENRDFRALYARGQTTAGPCLAVYTRRNRTGALRLGITVSTKLGGAVQRNRVRRRIKEAYRLSESRFAGGHDLVIVARHRAATVKFTALRDELLRLCGRLKLLESTTDAGLAARPEGKV